MPKQKALLVGAEAQTKAPMAILGSDGSPAKAISDILPGGSDSEYRWTNQRPRVQCWLEDDGPWMLSVQVISVGEVMKKTGPQMLTFRVNDVTVGTKLLNEAKNHTLEFPVPRSALAARQPAKAGFDIDKVLVSTDGTKLGVLAKSVGFRRASR